MTGKKIRSTIIVDPDIWKEVRIESIRRDMEISQFVELALRKELMTSLDERRAKIGEVQDLNKVVDKSMKESMTKQHKQQKLLQYQSSNLRVFKDDTAEPYQDRVQGGKGPLSISILLQGIKFPVAKDKILELTHESLHVIFEILPDKNYATKRELQEAVQQVYNSNKDTRLKNLFDGSEMLDVNIYTNNEEWEESNRSIGRREIEYYKADTGKNDIYVKVYLPADITFPTNKHDLLYILKRERYDLAADTFRMIKDKTYKNIEELEEEIIRKSKIDPYNERKLAGCTIIINNNDKNREENFGTIKEISDKKETLSQSTQDAS